MCYDCNRQTKSKLDDEKKIQVCLASLSDKKQTEKETQSIFYYSCII